MQITLHGAQLRCEFRYTKRTGPAITERIKRIQGWQYDGETKTWWVPASEGHRLLALFPKAEFSVDAIWACTDAYAHANSGRFFHMCRSLGIALHLDAAGRVYASGDNVSQTVATEVARRSELLRPYVAAQHDEATPAPFADAQPTAADERMAAGLRNAFEADRRKRGIVAGQRRKRYEKRGEGER